MIRKLAFALLLTSAASAPAGALEQAGLRLSLSVPATFQAGRTVSIQGWLHAYAAAPIVFEYARGLPSQSVDVLVDGATVATVSTDSGGMFRLEVLFGPEQATRTVEAVAYRGTVAETRSETFTLRIERILIGLRIMPPSSTIGTGTTATLTLLAEYDDGREEVANERAVWTSSNPSVASVSNAAGTRGVITGVSPGSATITASLETMASSAAVHVT